MLTWLKAGPAERCVLYGHRFETYRYCQACGTVLKPIERCCEQENSYRDTGCCGSCGKPKHLRFMTTQPSGAV